MSSNEFFVRIANFVSSLFQDAFEGSESVLVSADRSCQGDLIPGLVSFVSCNPDVMAPWVYEYAGSIVSRHVQDHAILDPWSEQKDLVRFEFRFFLSLVKLLSFQGARKTTALTAVVSGSQPKRRGRPPKNKSAELSDAEASPQPKRRGRPPKNQPVVSAESGSGAMPSNAMASPQPKRRGRPPKNHPVASTSSDSSIATSVESRSADALGSNGGRVVSSVNADDDAWVKVAKSAYKKTMWSRGSSDVDDADDADGADGADDADDVL